MWLQNTYLTENCFGILPHCARSSDLRVGSWPGHLLVRSHTFTLHTDYIKFYPLNTFLINLYFSNHFISYFIFLFNYKARDNTNKKITIYYVVWTRLTRLGCFNWLAHYKQMRIAEKKTMYIVHFKHKNDDKSGKW